VHFSGTLTELTEELSRIIRKTLQGTIGDPVQEAACDAIDQAVRQIAAGVWSDQDVTTVEAVAILDSMMRDVNVPVAPDGFEVEVMGWLDSFSINLLRWFLMGIREGTVPSAPLPDGWLNYSQRTGLG
jgi:hypothetical protein